MCYKRKHSLCFYYSVIIVLVFLRLGLEIPKQPLKFCFSKHAAIASGGVTLHCSSVEKQIDLGVVSPMNVGRKDGISFIVVLGLAGLFVIEAIIWSNTLLRGLGVYFTLCKIFTIK